MERAFEDQVVIVTGGGRGIGRAVGLEFASEGAHVMLAGRQMDALHLAAAECNEAGGSGHAVSCDVAIEEDLVALVEATLERYGRVDILVNNAGAVAGGRLDEIDPADVHRILDVNVWATIRLAQLVVPHMRAARHGTIVNMSSLAGRMGVPYYATYCASKFAVRGFSEALRRELRPDGVHVMAVFPGGTATDMVENVEFERVGLGVVTADQAARVIVRGVRWRSPEVFMGAGETLLSHWNDMLPWTLDYGADFVRERVHAAVMGAPRAG